MNYAEAKTMANGKVREFAEFLKGGFESDELGPQLITGTAASTYVDQALARFIKKEGKDNE